MSELLPCPFCPGKSYTFALHLKLPDLGEPLLLHYYQLDDGHMCPLTGVHTIVSWNRRAEPAGGGWVRCEERLPADDAGHVLTYWPGRKVWPAKWEPGWKGFVLWGRDADPPEVEGHTPFEVTHWRPLPAPPEEE